MYFEALNAHREVICLSKARPSYHRTHRGTVRSFSYRDNRKLIKALNSLQFEGHFFFSMAEDTWTLAEWRIGGVSSWQGAGVGFYFITSLSHPWASWGNHHSLQWLHWTLQFRLFKNTEQGPGHCRRKPHSMKPAYTFTNCVSVLNTFHCVQM